MSDEKTGMAVIEPQTKMQVHQGGETAGMALAAQAKALVEARYTIALRQPRNIEVVRQKLLHECSRPSFAAIARYRKPIGKGIEGPSIRFAEAALREMGNVLIETPTVYEDEQKRIVRVSVSDMEANVAYAVDITIWKRVERRSTKAGDTVIKSRTNSTGQTVYTIEATDDETLNQTNALISKAIRTNGLRLVPQWLTDECMDAVVETMRKKDAADPDAARHKLFDAFAGVGVSADQLAEYLGHESAKLAPKEMENLRGLFAALRDGETTWREVMDAKAAEKAQEKAQPGKGAEALKTAVQGGKPPAAG